MALLAFRFRFWKKPVEIDAFAEVTPGADPLEGENTDAESDHDIGAISPTAGTPHPEVARVVAEELVQCRERIRTRLNEAKDVSTAEVIAAGTSIEKIVHLARGHVEAQSDSVGAVLNQQITLIRDYTEGTNGQVVQQAEVAGRALELSTGIAEAGVTIRKLAKAARLLALNARIEATALGDAGRPVSVLAGEMKNLSDSIEKANAAIAKLASELLKCLPEIASTAEGIRTNSREFVERVERLGLESQIFVEDSQTQAAEVISRIVSSAGDALSHLQFQDPHIQSVLSIDHLLSETYSVISENLGEFIENPPPLAEVRMGDMMDGDAAPDDETASSAGEVMLF